MKQTSNRTHGRPFLMEENKMKLDKNIEVAKQEALQILNTADNKAEGILEAIEKVAAASNKELIEKIQLEAEQAKSDEEYRKSLKLRVLSKDEKEFYEKFSNLKQALTAEQIDIIPTTVIDRTLDDVKKRSTLLNLVNFTPAGVKKWIVASKTGTFGWGGLNDALTKELNASITTLNAELGKLHVLLVIPKAIRDLSLPFVDRYFTAILEEAFYDGLEYGFLQGNGQDQPIGIYNQINKSSNGIHAAKTVLSTVTGFSPKELIEVRKTLSNNGKRPVNALCLVCHPMDRYEFVDPALFGETLGAGYVQKSFTPIEVIECPNNPQGKAAFTIKSAYVMGCDGMILDEYKETKAIDDCDLIIAKTYANGRAIDDNTAVIFDVTKLKEYVPKVLAMSSNTAPIE